MTMIITTHCYVITRRKGDAIDLHETHRRLEHARKELARLRDEYKEAGSRTMLTQSGCCLRAQKGESVIYYEITKMELK